MSSTQDMLYKNENKNMVKSYCENYDKAKNEPFYDVIASQIATLNQIDFDRNFTYCAVNLMKKEVISIVFILHNMIHLYLK